MLKKIAAEFATGAAAMSSGLQTPSQSGASIQTQHPIVRILPTPTITLPSTGLSTIIYRDTLLIVLRLSNHIPRAAFPHGIGNRPSPPFAPSSLGSISNVSAEGVITGEDPAGNKITVPTRKRYSSSFRHRYVASGGAGSEGGAGSADRKELNERPGSASFLSTNTDDDEISVFVQDIDSRKPLSDRHRVHRQREDDHFHEP
ncbi:hypothetical protein BD779DRAFT_1681478 [Infundibulicybe gibba]|nr:hypothetical protein BD779DRAFT_1681478 [Infundibulicybe gibba]